LSRVSYVFAFFRGEELLPLKKEPGRWPGYPTVGIGTKIGFLGKTQKFVCESLLSRSRSMIRISIPSEFDTVIAHPYPGKSCDSGSSFPKTADLARTLSESAVWTGAVRVFRRM
jgi:hypothetical protein